MIHSRFHTRGLMIIISFTESIEAFPLFKSEQWSIIMWICILWGKYKIIRSCSRLFLLYLNISVTQVVDIPLHQKAIYHAQSILLLLMASLLLLWDPRYDILVHAYWVNIPLSYITKNRNDRAKVHWFNSLYGTKGGHYIRKFTSDCLLSAATQGYFMEFRGIFVPL